MCGRASSSRSSSPTPDAATAKARVTEMADKLLANPVIESYRVEVLP